MLRALFFALSYAQVSLETMRVDKTVIMRCKFPSTTKIYFRSDGRSYILNSNYEQTANDRLGLLTYFYHVGDGASISDPRFEALCLIGDGQADFKFSGNQIVATCEYCLTQENYNRTLNFEREQHGSRYLVLVFLLPFIILLCLRGCYVLFHRLYKRRRSRLKIDKDGLLFGSSVVKSDYAETSE